MNIKTISLVYFSPTRTTKKVLHAITKGFGTASIEKMDLSLPQKRDQVLPPVTSDLLIIGMPVYEEHIPNFVLPALNTLQGNGQPAVAVAVYGNVGYGIVLRQLADIIHNRGFHLAAGGAFIGEHSFSHSELPIAVQRPDVNDLEIAAIFGKQVAEKLAPLTTGSDLPRLDLPGHLPLQARILPEFSSRWFAAQPDIQAELCNSCGACAKVCPVGAIDPQTFAIDPKKCVRCFACVRACPKAAREIQLKIPWVVKRFLNSAKVHPQQPTLFL
jgi:ferredoxin/flavodoxin